MSIYLMMKRTRGWSSKESHKSLGEGDKVRARVIAVSLNEKEPRESKIGLTMRQTGLGRLEWLRLIPMLK